MSDCKGDRQAGRKGGRQAAGRRESCPEERKILNIRVPWGTGVPFI